MSTTALTGRRMVVLGASSGMGRAFAVRASKAGADVLFAARRQDRLEETRSEAGGGSVLAIDVAEPEQCRLLGEEVARSMAPIDVVVSTVGSAPLRRIEETTADEWLATLRTNVVGLSCAVSALLPSLAPGAMVLALSSETVAMPRWAMAAYGASKAALEATIRSWRVEHPAFRFGVVGVGSTVPTEFGDRFEEGILGTALEVWTTHGQAQESFMDSEEVGDVLVGLVSTVLPYPGINMEHVTLRTPSAVVGHSEVFQKAAADQRARREGN